MKLQIEDRTDYDQRIYIEKSPCPFYSKKAMKKLCPKSDFVIAGSIGKGLKNKIGEVYHREKGFSYYANNYSRLRFKPIGYVPVGENTYLEVVKPKGLKVLLLWLFLIGLILSSLFYFMKESDIDPLAKDYIPANGEMLDTNPDRITLPSYKQITLETGTDTAYVALFNPPKNPCYFKFTIYLEERNEKLFESKMIPPGQAITEVKLDRTFQEGVYPITINIETFALEGKEALNGGLIKSQLVAVNDEDAN